MGKKGYATVEASIVITLFLFAMLAFWQLGMLVVTQERIFCDCVEAVEAVARDSDTTRALAEQENQALLAMRVYTKTQAFWKKNVLAQQYVSGGSRGILITKAVLTEEGMLEVGVQYTVCLRLPLLQQLKVRCREEVVQKVYTGYVDTREAQTYVYITDYESVYHVSRNCSHLLRQVQAVTAYQAEHSGQEACRYCRDLHSGYYLTAHGACYHRSLACPALARTIRRVKKSEVGGLGACSRCGG